MKTIPKDIEEKIDNLVLDKNYITKAKFIYQVENLKETIFNEVKEFDIDKEYYDVFCQFRKSVENKYLRDFNDILEITIRVLIHEIYLSIDSVNQINVLFEPIQDAPSNKRKHYEVAKQVATSTLKMYFLNPKSDKTILMYIDDFLPNNYINDDDIDLVVWYFIIYIVICNIKYVNNQ